MRRALAVPLLSHSCSSTIIKMQLKRECWSLRINKVKMEVVAF